MNFVIISGMSGAGKSHCVKYFEDIGYFCVDNIPPALIPKFAELARTGGKLDNVAFIVDIRGGELFLDLFPALNQVKAMGVVARIVFLDASDNVLIKRFKESRRMHPLALDGRVADGIEAERRILEKVKSRADFVIDTSNLLPKQLRQQIMELFVEGRKFQGLMVSVVSFGFKYGIPIDCDMVFDVRFLPNPYYIEELKPKTGLDPEVFDYVLAFPETGVFLDKLVDMVQYLLPQYVEEGKNQLVIGIGCTGGKHRSVTVARVLASRLQQGGAAVVLEHRDVERDNRSDKG